jgi:hypothetical protein
MEDTMKIARIALIAAVTLVAAAPAASASVPVDRGSHSTSQHLSDFSKGSGYAEMATHREAIATRNWEQIAEPPVVALSPAPGNGFDAVPTFVTLGGLTLLLITLVLSARWAIRRRRTRVGALA